MRTGDNIRQRTDGRFEARYIKGRDSQGHAIYGSCYGKTWEEAAEKREVLLQGFRPIRELNLLILGFGSHGQEVRELAESLKVFREIAFLDDERPEAIGPIRNLSRYVDTYPVAIPAVGDQNLRMRWLEQLAQAGFILPVLIHPSATVSPSAKVNYGTVICARAVIGPGAVVGRGSIISGGAAIDRGVLSGRNICPLWPSCINSLTEKISGGETTEGAVDEFLRHSITKMSLLHFTGCEEYRRRVIQLGEAPERVFNVGEPGVENAVNLAVLTPEELRADLGFPRPNRPYAVVTFHPVTLERETGEGQLRQLIRAMDAFPWLDYIITLANADAGGRGINRIWEEESVRRRNWLVIPSLGAKRYVSALRSAAFVLGNSSSGITEAPSFCIPTVNIGDRQKGRVMAESVLCCQPCAGDIESAMRRAMTPEFRAVAARTVSPFGDGHTSEKILPELLRFLESPNKSLKKTFYDISFEV